MNEDLTSIQRGDGPILAVAVHNGHQLRPDTVQWMRLGDEDRLREEDPWTGEWTIVGDSRVVVHRSRFEVDLNRPRDQAVYRRPEDAWGLPVWSPATPEAIFEESLRLYDQFYVELRALLDELVKEHRRVAVLDLHTYNHRRQGPAAREDNPAANPEINVGTGTMFRPRWEPLVDRFISDLGSYRYRDRRLDVRENVRFRGGYLPRWIHTEYPHSVCVLSIEVKKFFMDEWTGRRDAAQHAEILQALRSTLPGVREELANARRHEST